MFITLPTFFAFSAMNICFLFYELKLFHDSSYIQRPTYFVAGDINSLNLLVVACNHKSANRTAHLLTLTSACVSTIAMLATCKIVLLMRGSRGGGAGGRTPP